MKRVFILIIIILSALQSNAQSYRGKNYSFWQQISVGWGNDSLPDPSAWQQWGGYNTTKGILLPRIEDTTSISSPVIGDFAFALSDSSVYYYSNHWVKLSSGAITSITSTDNSLNVSGTNLTLNTSHANVWNGVQTMGPNKLVLHGIGSTGGVTVTFAPSSSSNYTIALPPSQGSNGQTLVNDGTGQLSWGASSAGLDDVCTVSNVTTQGIVINSNSNFLVVQNPSSPGNNFGIVGTNAIASRGSSSKFINICGACGNQGAINMNNSSTGLLLQTATTTANRTVTIPDASGTIPIVTSNRVTGATTSGTIVTSTVGSSDASYIVSANINVTSSTTHSFTVTCTYTNESNNSVTLTEAFTQLTGSTLLTTITNITGSGSYEGISFHIRAKAGTTITWATTGTFTSVTYNAEGIITQY